MLHRCAALLSRACACLTLLALTGCVGNRDKESVVDQGELCLLTAAPAEGASLAASPAAQDLASDQPIAIVVRVNACLSSSCDLDRMASCTAELSGNELTVHSSFKWERHSGSCTADCGGISASCASPSLPAGEYTVRHGGNTQKVTIPSSVATPCTLR